MEKITIAEAFEKLRDQFDFKDRPRQIVMANYLAAPLYYRNVEDSPLTTAVVEGGTGIGKTMAYLLPVVLAQKGLLADALAPEDIAHVKNLSTLIRDNALGMLKGEPEIKGKIVGPFQPGKQIFVSTSSKLLQGQLMGKDLKLLKEFLRKQFAMDLRYVKVEGSGNYVCGKKVEKFIKRSEEAIDGGAPLLRDTLDTLEIAKIIKAANAQTIDDVRNATKALKPEMVETFIEGENTFSPNHDTHNCSQCASKCKFFDLMQEARAADVVVMNHHWFAHNIFRSAYMFEKGLERAEKEAAAKGLAKPEWTNKPDSIHILNARPVMIFDEAHDLEQAMVKASSTDISLMRYRKQISSLGTALDETTGATTGVLALYVSALQTMGERLETACEYQKQCIEGKTEPDTAECWKPVHEQSSVLLGLGAQLEQVYGDGERMTTLGDMQTALLWRVDPTWNKLRDTTKALDGLFAKLFDKNSLQYNAFDQAPSHVALMPITTGHILKQWARWQNMTKIFCSATLATDRGKEPFKFFLRRVGIRDETVLSAIAASPFDYDNNTALFLPKMPNPGKDNEKEEWRRKVVENIPPLVELTGGGSLFLFTSREQMRDAYDKVADGLREKGYKTGMQGVGSLQSLRELFKEHDNAVVFGVESFWQGLDVPGRGLRSLIVVKLPFDNPYDAFVKANVKAQVEWLLKAVPDMGEVGARRRVFNQFQVPRAVLAFKQGFGRLIREEGDKGLFTVLDPRFFTASYAPRLASVLTAGIPIKTTWEKAAEAVESLGLHPGHAVAVPPPFAPPPVTSSSLRRMSASCPGA